MKLFFHQLYGISLLLIGITIFGMQKQQALVTSNFSSILEQIKCDEYKDQRSHIFKWFDGKDGNALRKTCTKFNILFSFCNPSHEFIACNENIHKKDMKSIFFAALYDGNHAIAQCFIHKNNINKEYKITDTSYMNNDFSQHSALYPADIIQVHTKVESYSLLEKLELKSSNKKLLHCEVHPLLIACISRNSQRVENVLVAKIILPSVVIKQAFDIAIEHDDGQIIAVLCKESTLQDFVKRSGARLTRQAIFYAKKKSCEALIMSNTFDINQKITIMVQTAPNNFYDDFLDFSVEEAEVFTLLDYLYHEKSSLEGRYKTAFITEIKNLLAEIENLLVRHGAKTAETLNKKITN